MVLCPICGKEFTDKRGLYGHSRFVHFVEFKGGKLAKMATPTEVTKEEIDEINEGLEQTEANKEKGSRTRSLDKEINEAREEIKQLSKEIRRLTKGVKNVRDKSKIGGSDRAASVVPSTSEKAGGELRQPVLERENIDADTARSGGGEEEGMPEEEYDDTAGGVLREIIDFLPGPRKFLWRWRRK